MTDRGAGARRPLTPAGTLFARDRGAIRYVAMTIWLIFLVVPIVNAIGNREPGAQKALAIAAATLFVGATLTMIALWRRRGTERAVVALSGVAILIACLLTVFDRPGWGFLFTYCVAISSLIAPKRLPLLGLAVCTILAGVMTSLGGADGGTALGFVASTVGVGLLIVLMRDLRLRNDELTEARAELAQMAVAAERERFARDLHDLLGHSLSVIALKAELAGRLLPERPDDAAREIDEVQSVARSALTDVREAVSGYRRPTLDDEIDGARMALTAAGISADVTRAPVTLSPEVEAVLAWSVREGATNVIRHSGASHCSLRVAATLTSASVEVVDDGAAMAAGSGRGGNAVDDRGGNGLGDRGGNGLGDRGGNGLGGLAERARLLHGSLDAGPRPEGGFALVVTVPVNAS